MLAVIKIVSPEVAGAASTNTTPALSPKSGDLTGIRMIPMVSTKVSVPTPATFTLSLNAGTFARQEGQLLGSKGPTLEVSPKNVTVTKASLNDIPFNAPDPVAVSV